MGDQISLQIAAESGEYESWEEPFLEQVDSLRRGLAQEGIPIKDSQQEGKGLGEVSNIIEIFVAGGAGLAVICRVLTVWIRERGKRHLRLTIRRRNSEIVQKEIDATNVSEDAILRFLEDGQDSEA